MADYSMMGSFSTGGASSLNGELIQKLHDAESKSKVDPIEKNLELWNTEKEKMDEIQTKVAELLEAVKPFDLFNSGSNAFEQVTASTTGESAVFDASDVGTLKPGTMIVDITQVSQKDAYQTKIFSSADDTITATAGQSITVNGQDFAITGVTLSELATTINNNGTVSASVEQVSDSEYRLVIKSNEPGTANSLTISETDVSHLGLTDTTDTDADGITDNHVLVAQNLKATVDGIDYDLSSNSITINDNLKITATKVGESSISIQADDSYIVPAVEEMATKYNELLLLITEELYSEDISVQDTSTLKDIAGNMKNMMYESFGTNDSSLFNYGFSFDKLGMLEIDSAVLGSALTEDLDAVKDLFLGVAEDKGFGTLLKEHIDSLNSYNGLFNIYETSMDSRKTKLEEDQKKAVEALDTKYDTMAAQFAAYGSMITEMESSFSGLKMMIEQESSS